MNHFTEEERLEYARNTTPARPDDEIHPSVRFGLGATYGKEGFGFVRDEKGFLIPMPHQGNVVIEADVVIGANTCIDRAAIGSTIIGQGTKVDNLVHIAHGAKIGKHCLIVAGAVIGGSAEIGDFCFVGINASILQKVKIGDRCIIGAGAVVLEDVENDSVMIGNPARLLRKVGGNLPDDTESKNKLLNYSKSSNL